MLSEKYYEHCSKLELLEWRRMAAFEKSKHELAIKHLNERIKLYEKILKKKEKEE